MTLFKELYSHIHENEHITQPKELYYLVMFVNMFEMIADEMLSEDETTVSFSLRREFLYIKPSGLLTASIMFKNPSRPHIYKAVINVDDELYGSVVFSRRLKSPCNVNDLFKSITTLCHSSGAALSLIIHDKTNFNQYKERRLNKKIREFYRQFLNDKQITSDTQQGA